MVRELVRKNDGKLLGVTIVGARVGEVIHEWIVALERNMKVGNLVSAMHVYPTYSTASMQAAADIRVSQLLNGTSGRFIRRLTHLIR